MFAGPNGSGKSELKKYLPNSLLGVYLNPDEIERNARLLELAMFQPTGKPALSLGCQAPRVDGAFALGNSLRQKTAGYKAGRSM